MHSLFPACCLAAGWTAAAAGSAAADREAAVRALTEAPTRIVWSQDLGDGRQTGGTSATLRLMGFDSEDGRGERPILAAPANYAKPLLTPDGRQVIYSDIRDGSVRLVGWDGRGARVLAKGYAVAVWRDPDTGTDWVYAGVSGDPVIRLQPLFRFPLDDPDRRETVWTRTPVDADNIQLSANGRYASANYPWPDCGILTLPDGALQRLGTGCWPALAPDNSRRFWIFDGAHRNLALFEPDTGRHWDVPIHRAPGIDGFEVYHPRWSSHPRFLVMTGPYTVGDGDNRIRGGGPGVEIYLGRFAADYRSVAAWVRVTSNACADFYPDAWIAGGRNAGATPGATPAAAPGAPWPSHRDDLLFLWERRSAANEVGPDPAGRRFLCRVEPRGRARYGRHFEMDTAGAGAFVADPERVETLLAACGRTLQVGLELVVTPRRASPTGPARILDWASGATAFNVSLAQAGDRLVLRGRSATAAAGTEPWLDLGPLRAGAPRHVIVTATPTRLAWFLDGQPAGALDNVGGGNWGRHPLVFGNAPDDRAPWDGTLEYVALYARWIPAAEAQRNYRRIAPRLADRKPPPHTVLEARALDLAAIPDPAAIAPYRRALAVNRYAVVRTLAGAPPAGGELLAAHWVILDGAALPEARRASNQVYRLTLDPFEAHPELEGERLMLDNAADHLPWYYEAQPATPAAAP